MNLEMDPKSPAVLGVRQNRWRFKKLYPGILLELGDGHVAPESTDLAPQLDSLDNHLLHSIPSDKKILAKIPAKKKPVTQQNGHGKSTEKILSDEPNSMESFNKYESDVSDAWSADADDDESETASSATRQKSRDVKNGHTNNAASKSTVINRQSSQHLRAKGLQRLALQGSAASSVAVPHRPGMAVRSISMGFADHLTDNSSTRSAATEFSLLPRNALKAEKFDKLLSSKSFDLEELRKLSWSGIPSEQRAVVWRMLTGYLPPIGDKVKVQEYLDRKRDEYRSLVSEYYPKREDDQYKDSFRQIHIDVPRMCPLVPLFQQIVVQEIFERILFIWALRNPASGYVQGINDLVTPYFLVFLRDHVPAKEPVETFPSDTLSPEILMQLEADSFWCLSKLLAGIQSNYTFAQPGIQQRVIQLKELVQRVDADLHGHLEKCHVEYLQFSFRWMNNLLIRELPLRCVIRLWDSYHSEPDGFANFHVYVCASFLLWWSSDLRTQPDFQYTLLLLQNLPTQNWGEDEIERLLAKAFMLKYTFADAPSHLRHV